MSVLTITPNPSSVGDTVAVATVATVPNYDLLTGYPFVPLVAGYTIETQTATSITVRSDGSGISAPTSIEKSITIQDFVLVMDMYFGNVGTKEGGLQIRFFDSGGALLDLIYIYRIAITGEFLVSLNNYGDIIVTTLIDPLSPVTVTLIGNLNGGVSAQVEQSGTIINGGGTLATTGLATITTVPVTYDLTRLYVANFASDIAMVTPYSLEQDAVEITSGTTTGGAISYDHTAQISDNGTDWKYIVDGVDSNIVTMLVESGSYYTPLTPFSCTLNLKMEIRKGYANTNSIFDWGSTADTYKTDATYVSEGYTIWDRPTANVPETNLNVNGFYPFGNLFASDVAGYRYPVYQGKANFHGAFHSWAVELIPDSSAGYNYDTSPWVARNVTGFSFGSLVNFPFPNCTPEAEYSISYNRIGNVVRESDSGEASEHRPFSMQWNNLCGEDLRGILIQIITVNRGFSFPISAGSSLARLGAWLPREGESLSGVFNVRLVSPLIEYTCTDADLWDLEIKVMKWES